MGSTFILDPYRTALSTLHDHICPRQILGLRIGLYGAELLHVPIPQADKRLIVFVETNGCFADGVAVATGCTVGHRTLYLADYGKVAATLIDSETELAIRVMPHLDSRTRALRACPDEESHWLAYLKAYQIMGNEELFVAQPVSLSFSLPKLISHAGRRVMCDLCGEEILNEREIARDSMVLCRACAGDAYYEVAASTILRQEG